MPDAYRCPRCGSPKVQPIPFVTEGMVCESCRYGWLLPIPDTAREQQEAPRDARDAVDTRRT